MTSTNKSKTRKFSGPIRWKGFIPIVVMVACTVIYFTFFFDTHVKWALEWGGSRINGAKVDISTLRTSFINCQFELTGLEWGYRGKPLKNLFGIDRIHFQFLGSQLFRKKLVITDFSVKGLHYGTDRKTPNTLPDPPPPPPGPSLMDRLTSGFGSMMEDQFGGNPLQQLGQLAANFDIKAELDKAVKELKSVQHVAELQKQIQSTKESWQKQINNLPNEQSLQNIENRINQVAQASPKSPQDFINTIKSAQQVGNDIQTEVNKVTTAKRTVEQGANQLAGGIASIDNMVEADVSTIAAKANLPQLNFDDMSPQILGPKALELVQQITKWVDISRRLMPKGKKSGETAVVERKRAMGTDVQYGRLATYPSFLLKEGTLTSDLGADPSKGKAQGKIEGLTSAPPIWGKPTIASLDADFPKEQILGAHLDLIVDHTGEIASEEINLSVAAFPISDFMLSEGGDLTLGLRKATSKAAAKLRFEEDRIHASFTGVLNNVEYVVDTANASVKKAIERVLSPLRSINFVIRLEGTVDSPKLYIASNIGSQLAKGLQQEFNHQVAAVQNKIRKEIDSRIADKKQMLQKELDQAKAKALAPINKELAKIAALKNRANHEVNRIKGEQSRQVEAAAQKAIQKALPKIKIPGF